MPHRLTFLVTIAFWLSAPSAFASNRPPNVLIILTDDQGWGDLSLHGNSNLSTPHLDQLAKSGAQFSHFYVCPVCSPTRAEMLTGRWHPRGGVRDVTSGGERLDTDETTIADVFRAAGYRTGLFGKWHNGTQGPYHPNARGFDEFYGFSSGHWGHYFSPMLEQNDDLTRGNGYLPDDLTDHAIDFMTVKDDRPFFTVLTLNTPHSPMQVPDSWWQRVENRPILQKATNPDKEDIQFTRAALAMVENIDWNAGRLMKALQDQEHLNNTIVVFFHDNGPNSDRWNGGMRGKKGTVDEGGLRSPLLIRWPGQIAPNTTITRIAGAVDLLPTLAELAQVAPRVAHPLDGRSLAPLLKDPAAPWSDRVLFAHWNKKISARNQRFRLDDTGRLYDIENDPGQTVDVKDRHPEAHQQLMDSVEDYRNNVLSEITNEPRPLTIDGAAGIATTLLPARDASISGGLQRSSRHPNCSFITHWTSTDDRIQWDVRLIEAGVFDVELLYTCSALDVGSTLELVAGSDTGEITVKQFQVDRAADSPLLGASEDRVPRTESLVKDFSVLKVGAVTLSKETRYLALRARSISAQQAMDFRLLKLRRVVRQP